MTEFSDIIAVQRAHTTDGRDAALAEIRRRWPYISETVLEATLERILAAPVDPPASNATRGAQRDPIGHTRKNRSR